MTTILIYIVIFGFIDLQLIRRKIGISVATHVTSTIHSFLIAKSSLWYLLEWNEYEDWVDATDISMAYLIVDISIALWHKNKFGKNWKSMIVHHLLFMIILYFCKEQYTEEVAMGLLAEWSNLPLNAGWFMIKYGKENTILFKMTGAITLVSWTLLRIVNFTYITYIAILRRAWIGAISGMIVTAMNWYWHWLLTSKFWSSDLTKTLRENHNHHKHN